MDIAYLYKQRAKLKTPTEDHIGPLGLELILHNWFISMVLNTTNPS